MTIIKALKYEIAKSSERAIKKRSKQLKLTFLYKPVLNILNTSQYKKCSCVLTCLKSKMQILTYRPDFQNMQATGKKATKVANIWN